MRGTDALRSILMVVMGLAAVACGAQSKASSEPATPQAQPATPAAPSSSEATDGEGSGQEEMGMQFEDKDEGERTERTPPPTRSWQPVDKEKQAKTAREPANK